MGLNSSTINKAVRECEEDLSYLDITKVEIKMFYKIFNKISLIDLKDEGGENRKNNTSNKNQEVEKQVTVGQILQFAKLPYSHFAARALCSGFCNMSEGKSEENQRLILKEFQFDFKTFVLSMWNFLSLCPQAYISFVFSLYDQDGGGYIDPSEAQTLLRDLHGDDFTKNLKVIQAYNNYSMQVASKINIENFHTFVNQNDDVIAPAFVLQDELTYCILGSLYWFIKTKKRKDLYLYEYRHVSRVIDMIRIMRQKDAERNWENSRNSREDCNTSQNILVLDNEENTQSTAIKKEKGKVTFADNDNRNDAADNTSNSFDKTSRIKYSGTAKYFFGSRPNTPSKQLSYFLDKFYEKPNEVKVWANSKTPLEPYSRINTFNKKKQWTMPTVVALVDSNYTHSRNKEEVSETHYASKEEKKKEILNSITDLRTCARGQDFLNSQLKVKEEKHHGPTKYQLRQQRKQEQALLESTMSNDGLMGPYGAKTMKEKEGNLNLSPKKSKRSPAKSRLINVQSKAERQS